VKSRVLFRRRFVRSDGASPQPAQARSAVAVRLLQYEELMPDSQDLCLEHGSIPEALPNQIEQVFSTPAPTTESSMLNPGLGKPDGADY